MKDYFNMELVHALNPIYALPIATVILCACIVYFFGFKSPVQPSFEGIETERKISKKRRAKEANKNKTLQNGKLSEHVAQKAPSVTAAKKKDTHEKHTAEKHSTEKHAAEKQGTEKQPSQEKTNKNIEKGESKAAKKARIQNEMQEALAKKEAIIEEDVDDDGWIQLISKRRKNRKKEEVSPKSEIQVNLGKVPSPKKVEIKISDPAEVITPLEVNTDVQISGKDAKAQRKAKQAKGENKKEIASDLTECKDKNAEKEGKDVSLKNQTPPEKKTPTPPEKKTPTPPEKKTPTPPEKNPPTPPEKNPPTPPEKKPPTPPEKKTPTPPEKKTPTPPEKKNQTPPENKVVEPKPVAKPNEVSSEWEETKSKSKKKKKKSPENVSNENISGVNAVEAPSVQDAKEKAVEVTISSIKPPKDLDDKGGEQAENKASNVVFDELAGLYPEEKEQKKRKKVRRDH